VALSCCASLTRAALLMIASVHELITPVPVVVVGEAAGNAE
jgi:hypothetical protein